MRWSLGLVAALVMAGCSDAPDEDPDRPQAPEVLGTIRGVVVDAAIQPLAGAAVHLEGWRNQTTDGAGAFSFGGLAPGPYVVQVALAGYQKTQTTTEAAPEPTPLRVVLERLPGSQPAIAADSFQGHITCSLRIPTAGFNDGCGVFGDYGLGSTQRKDIGFPAGNIHWVQTELVWIPTTPAAQRLCADQGELLHEEVVCGVSPIVGPIDRATVERRSLDNGETFRSVVYPDHLTAQSGNIVVDQSFELFSHAFYNFLPPDGWEFGRDGLPPVPT